MNEGRDAGRLDFPFAGIPSFLRSPLVQDLGQLDADVAVLGVPTDEGSPFMPGSRFGPRSIREHSLRFVTDPPGFFDPQERGNTHERIIHPIGAVPFSHTPSPFLPVPCP